MHHSSSSPSSLPNAIVRVNDNVPLLLEPWNLWLTTLPPNAAINDAYWATILLSVWGYFT